MPVFVVVNLPPIVLQVVVLLSPILINGTEVYASRTMMMLLLLLLLLLTPVSVSALSMCS
jgi:hypothetical protein